MAQVHNPVIKGKLEAVLNLLAPLLPATDISAAHKFLSSDEYAVTFEHICEEIYANNTGITPQIYQSLEEIGGMLGYSDQSHWADLSAQIR